MASGTRDRGFEFRIARLLHFIFLISSRTTRSGHEDTTTKTQNGRLKKLLQNFDHGRNDATDKIESENGTLDR